MSREVKCFLLVETDRVRRSLRRHASGPCQAQGGGEYSYHNAMVPLDEASSPAGQVIGAELLKAGVADDDPRWPTRCACGHEFESGDRQIFLERIYSRSDTGADVTLRDAPAGAMWWAWWYADSGHGSIYHKARGGGAHLLVRTPVGEWDVDSVASNGPGWQWTGEPPRVTATPSIGIGHNFERYHGWLRDGVLVEC